MSSLDYKTAMAQRREAIRKNREAFVRQLDALATEHRGEYALLKDGVIIGYFDTAADAIHAAMLRYPHDARYSVERVEQEPLYMGMYADIVAGNKD